MIEKGNAEANTMYLVASCISLDYFIVRAME